MVTATRSRRLTRALGWARLLWLAILPLGALNFFSARMAPSEDQDGSIPEKLTSTQEQVRHDLNWYAPLWERDLRQPPIPPAAPTPSAAPVPADVPRLVATFVDGQVRLAHLVDGQGRLQMKAVNESVGAFRVVTIEPGRAELSDGARSVWVEVPRPARPLSGKQGPQTSQR